MKVNFFVVTPPAILEGFPASFISAFRLEPDQQPVVTDLAQRFPNITVIDAAAAVRQAQGIIDQLIDAVQFVFLFALVAGLLVLYSALVATEDERRREAAVMRVYGASRAQVTGTSARSSSPWARSRGCSPPSAPRSSARSSRAASSSSTSPQQVC